MIVVNSCIKFTPNQYVSHFIFISEHFCSQDIVISSNLRVTWQASAMAPPPPLTCSAPDCEFSTPQGAPIWEMMSTLLNTHSLTVHNAGGGTTGGGSSSVPRLEKLPRPTFQLDMTQSEWAFKYYSQWQAYISQTPTQECEQVFCWVYNNLFVKNLSRDSIL